MILAANQPYFLPYIGYWQLINAADTFLICDDYNYQTQSWISRNRILAGKQEQYICLTVREASQNALIQDLFVSGQNDRKTMNRLENAYYHAPNFNQGMSLMEEILACEDKRLSVYLRHSMECVSQYLGITTPFRYTSELKQPRHLKREQRIYDFCEKLGADHYMNAIGGQKLYSYEDFRKHGIELSFLKCEVGEYPRFDNVFVPYLSIIDLIMFCERSDIQKKLTEFSVITESGAVVGDRGQGMSDGGLKV